MPSSNDVLHRLFDQLLETPRVRGWLQRSQNMIDIASHLLDQSQQESPAAPVPEWTEGRARMILGFGENDRITKAIIKKRQRALAQTAHPDRNGGSTEWMQQINAAAKFLLNGLG